MRSPLRGTPIRAHPLMLLFPLAMAALGAGGDIAALAVALAVHESFHLAAARLLRVGVRQLRLMPFGGAIDMENPYVLSPGQQLGVAAAGPLGNLAALVSAAALAHWGVLPPRMAVALVRSNLVLMLFNLLPALPLDGGRMLAALLSGRLGRDRAAGLGIALGRILAAALLALAVWAWIVRGKLNLSLVLCAVFILAAAPEERRALSNLEIDTMLNALTPPGGPIPARICAVSAGCPARVALRAADPRALTLYAVYDGGRFSGFTDDRRLLEAALARSPNAPVAAADPRRSPLAQANTA